MKKRSLVPWLLLSVLFSAMPPAKPRACLTCNPGHGLNESRCVECEVGQYCSQRNGEDRCNDCTAPCAENRNLIEVTACTNTSDRSCQCKAGYYCRSPVKLTCRRQCEPCINGFTNTSNLNRSCQKYTDCASLGMLVIKEGSPTSDHVCGNRTITHNPNRITTTLDSTTQRISLSTHKPHSTRSASTSFLTENFHFNEQSTVAVSSSETTAPPGMSAEVARTPEGNEGPVPPYEPLSKTPWIFLLLLLISLLCLVSCLSLKCKSRAIKNKLECVCPGLAYGRYQPRVPTARPNLNMETSVPVSDVTDTIREQVQGQGSFPGKNQQVTMEHVGKADGINNTVGSIFIYSPGMVILGSNSNEKKEEAETSGEDSGEDTRLMSVPQQESSSEEDSIRFATQEELGKELSIPIPATSK